MTMLQITARGAVPPTDVERSALREEFRLNHCVRVPALIEQTLLARIHAQLDAAVFTERSHGDVGFELCMQQNACLGLLHFLVNDPVVLQFVEFVSERSQLIGFSGRVYRKMAGSGHFDAWHTDAEPHRRVGMSLNLSRAVYKGGVFEIRERGGRPAMAFANTGPGDAILFAIADDFEHRITSIRGREVKTAFAGWFGASREARPVP